jgi:hypothetical protein
MSRNLYLQMESRIMNNYRTPGKEMHKMDNIGMLFLDNKGTTVSYTFIDQIFEICGNSPMSHAFLMGLDIGTTIVLQEPNGNKIELIIVNIDIDPVARWRAIKKIGGEPMEGKTVGQ